jgi:hypothetical protein
MNRAWRAGDSSGSVCRIAYKSEDTDRRSAYTLNPAESKDPKPQPVH